MSGLKDLSLSPSLQAHGYLTLGENAQEEVRGGGGGGGGEGREGGSRAEHNMLQSLPIILFSNSQKLSLLFFQFLPIILKFLPVMLIIIM